MREKFDTLIKAVTDAIGNRPLNDSLEQWLNQHYGPATDWYQAVAASCTQGIHDGWMCRYEAGGVKYGRVTKPSDATRGFSVDVVRMEDVRGPHHRHPDGEIDLILPITPGAQFDGSDAGWKVYGPDTAHCPTVSHGAAHVLYLLPAGKIEFTTTQ